MHRSCLVVVLLLALAAPVPSQASQVDDNWSAKVELRMANPYFGTEDDYFAPIHVILGPTGDLMLFGFRQDVPLIGGTGTSEAQITGSMSAVLPKASLAGNALPSSITLIDKDEHRDLSYGKRGIETNYEARYVEADPGDDDKEVLLDRLFCSGHVPLRDGSIVAFGGLRECWRWNTAPAGITFTNVRAQGGLPYAQRWDWAIDNPSWQRLAANLEGYGNVSPGARTQPHSGNWWFEGFLPPPPLYPAPPGIPGIFFGLERYYPTATVMLNGLVLVTGGTWYLEFLAGTATAGFFPQNDRRNLSVELYDPFASAGGGATQVLSDSDSPIQSSGAPATSPTTIFNPEYTFVFVLPKVISPGGYDVLMLGEPGKPVGFNVGAPDWHEPPSWIDRSSGTHPYPNNGASLVLLPLRVAEDGQGINDFGYHNGTVLAVGGSDFVPPDPNAKRGGRLQIDAFDPFGGAAGTGAWTMSQNLQVERQNCSAVILPDGRIAVVGGINMRLPFPGTQPPPFTANPLVKRAEYVDLRSVPGQLTMGQGLTSMAEYRAYHTAVLLLPDGRIWVGGGRMHGPPNLPFEETNFEILEPDYVGMPRPQITFISQKVLNRKNDPSSPAEPVLTTSVNVTMPQAQLAAEAEAVLIALGSHTHAFDMNQRYVQLENTTVDPLPSNTFTLTLEAPEYRWAPPGYYMLFVLDKNNIPSTSVMVRLE